MDERRDDDVYSKQQIALNGRTQYIKQEQEDKLWLN